MSGKIKVLTVQFDVTDLNEKSIARLTENVTSQGIFYNHSTEIDKFKFVPEDAYEADVFNVSVREVDTEES